MVQLPHSVQHTFLSFTAVRFWSSLKAQTCKNVVNCW